MITPEFSLLNYTGSSFFCQDAQITVFQKLQIGENVDTFVKKLKL